MAAYAATVTLSGRNAKRIAPGIGMLMGTVNITNYNTTLAEITAITKRLRTVYAVATAGATDAGFHLEWVSASGAFKAYYGEGGVFTGTANSGTAGVVTDNDSAATLGHALYVLPASSQQFVPPALTAEASATGLIKDSDTAAADGVIVYVVVDDPNFTSTYQLGHFEFVSPTDANGTCTIATGADTLTLYDDDAAATNGVAIRAVAAGGGLEATTGASKDILVPTSTGKYIHINHATTGSTPTVYFDEDAANTYERLQAVMVDNLDEPYSLLVDDAATENPGVAMTQGAPGRLASLVTVGPKPFAFTVGSSGPEVTVASRPDAASLPGSVALYVQAAGAGFNAANFGKEDLFVPTSTGEFIKIAYAASPTGVQVYGYPEGATADVRLLSVVADNADETYSTEAAIGWKRDTAVGTIADAASAEAASDVDVGAVNFIAVGVMP